MNNTAVTSNRIPAMSNGAIDKVNALADETKKLPQIHIPHHHMLHGGMYARSIMLPAGVVLTGLLIKVPTILIISGQLYIYSETGTTELSGYHVLAGAAHRKSAFCAVIDTSMTMLFATKAKTVKEAEDELTDEVAELMSRMDPATNHTMITGE